MVNVCVIGAGVVGLNTALELLNRIPNAAITILAEKFNTETTSDGAAGLFCPFSSFQASSLAMTKDIVSISYKVYKKLQQEFGEFKTGIIDTEGYVLSNLGMEEVQNPLIEDVLPEYRYLNLSELEECPGKFKYGSFFKSIIIQGRIFLPFALQKFQNAGGKIIQQKIEDVNELAELPFDVFVNCSGLGAKKLFKDSDLIPIRGQVIKVSAPWQKRFYLLDNHVYIIPGIETTLGGSQNVDSYDLNIDKQLSARIWRETTSVLPKLKEAAVVREWVGLRPHRPQLRIEVETLYVGGSKIMVVHNYGHGSQGVTTAPGSAQYAVALVLGVLENKSKL